MIFKDRRDAGRRLAERLTVYAGREDVSILGIPRGGVEVAAEIASALNVALDILLSRKLGVPGHEELAFGAVAAEDGRYLDQRIVQMAGLTSAQIERITANVKATLAERAALYRGVRAPLAVKGRTIVLVDDGIATGASMYAAIRALRQMHPEKLILAVPVAPPSACAWLRTQVDELVCLSEPQDFQAVGQFYQDFSQTTDQQVVDLLRKSHLDDASRRAAPPEAAEDPASTQLHLQGTLDTPPDAKGLVIFAHGSGSSRHSPRNRYVAGVLQQRGIATMLFDLLTPEEEVIDRKSSALRFDIPLLAHRLIGATRWAVQQPTARKLPIGFFGASTGAAAALVAAAQLPDIITCVVSRGGRPDLAGNHLDQVRAAVRLIVGAEDNTVLGFNRYAFTKLRCEHKDVVVIPGATHLFEEPGALEQVAQLAADWFTRYLPLGISAPAPSATRSPAKNSTP